MNIHTWQNKQKISAAEPSTLTGTSFLSFRMGTLGGIVDCLSPGPSLSPLCGEFSPLPTTTRKKTLNVSQSNNGRGSVCEGQRGNKNMQLCEWRDGRRLCCRAHWKHSSPLTRTLSQTDRWFQWVQSNSTFEDLNYSSNK